MGALRARFAGQGWAFGGSATWCRAARASRGVIQLSIRGTSDGQVSML